MREAVIVSTARTPIGRAFKGALNNIKSPTMMAQAIRHAVDRAGIDGADVEDHVIGSVLNAVPRFQYIVVSMCVGGGMGAAALFEVV